MEMAGTRRSLLGGITLGALLVGAAIPSVSGAGLGDTGTHEVGHVVLKGKGQLRGLMLLEPAGKSRTHVYLSLHFLRPNTAHDVIGSTRPCGKPLTNASRLFGLDVAASMETTEWQDIVLTGQVTRLRTMKSVRIIAEPRDGTATRTFCYQKITWT
jgi:hypothetical protein